MGVNRQQLLGNRYRGPTPSPPSPSYLHVESDYPGHLLCQDTFYVGRLKGFGRIYLQAVVDTYGSFGFAKLYTSKRPETSVDILYERVQPFYQQRKLPIQTLLTDKGTEYRGRPTLHSKRCYR